LDGPRRGEAMAALLGITAESPALATEVRLRLRGAAELGFIAHWPDGRREGAPSDRRDERAASLAPLEPAVADGKAGGRALFDAITTADRAPAAQAARQALRGAEAEALLPALLPPRSPRRRLRALWLWLLALLRALFGRVRQALRPIANHAP